MNGYSFVSIKLYLPKQTVSAFGSRLQCVTPHSRRFYSQSSTCTALSCGSAQQCTPLGPQLGKTRIIAANAYQHHPGGVVLNGMQNPPC